MIQLEKHFKKIETKINNLPDKLNFKIGETAQIVALPNYVLRYWEKEFPILKPEKFINRQRLYSKKDIGKILLIKYLIYEEKFSIEGLRKHLPSYYTYFLKRKNTETNNVSIEQKIHQILDSLSLMREEINSPPTDSPSEEISPEL